MENSEKQKKSKKIVSRFIPVFLCIILFCPQYIFPQITYSKQVPPLLQGIWQGKDRLILFSDDSSSFSCILRVFYSWYDDVAALPMEYAQLTSRDRNDTTSLHPENIEIEYGSLIENPSKTAGIYELKIKYPGSKDFSFIPLAVIDSKLYLDFYLKTPVQSISGESAQPSDSQNQNFPAKSQLLTALGTTDAIKIIPPITKNEIVSVLIDENSVYYIRYWLSQTEYSEKKAEFTDGTKKFHVNKNIVTGGKIYECTTGRSTKIRNIQKTVNLKNDFFHDKDDLIYTDSAPYMIKAPQKTPLEFVKIAEEQNRKKSPAPPPLFPPEEINFHWKEIDDLRKYNPSTWNRRNLDIHK